MGIGELMKRLLILFMVLAFAGTAQAKTQYGDFRVTGDLVVNGDYVGTAWLGLSDTPSAFTAGYYVKVNAGATALELVTAPTGTLPSGTNGQVLQHDGDGWVAQSQIDGLIDDSAGNGDVNDLWSADKTFDELATRDTAIALKEDSLGNPSTNDYILASQTDGTRSWVEMPGGSSEWTEQSADPLFNQMSTGDKVVATGSGDLFYKSATGLYNVSLGTYVVDPVTYTLTITDPGNSDAITCTDSDLSRSINCGNGNSICTATAVSTANITGLTAVPTSGRKFDNWTGAVSGSTNPTTANLAMSANRAVGGAFSVDATPSALYTAATAVWDFENNGNDTKATHNLTNNSATFGTTTPPQGTYYAVLNDASSQYFNIADHVDFDLNGSDYSMSFWTNLASLPNVMSKGYSGEFYYKISNQFDGVNVMQLDHTDNWSSSTESMIANSTGVWRHVVVSYVQSTKTATYWVSEGTFGSEVNATAIVMTQDPGDNAEDFRIGRVSASAYYGGSIDEFVIWKDLAITAEDAENIFDGTWR